MHPFVVGIEFETFFLERSEITKVRLLNNFLPINMSLSNFMKIRNSMLYKAVNMKHHLTGMGVFT